jgi:hypothetical protein
MTHSDVSSIEESQLHSEPSSISRLQDINCYYREFRGQFTPLLAVSYITMKEANLLFYKGIPMLVCKRIRHKIQDAHQMASSAPPISSVLSYLKATQTLTLIMTLILILGFLITTILNHWSNFPTHSRR